MDHSTTSSDYSSGRTSGQDVATLGEKVQETAREGVDILRENPVFTLVAVGVLGFAIGTLAGRSSVRNRNTLDANLASLQRAITAARSGASDTVGNWRQMLKNEGLMPDQIPGRLKEQIRRLLS
ncbi:hypothetical protein [Hyphomicrobium sp.]|jgi:hypothetical protein|uniref:hypothetical protein n=1 Tax=Hyphomicrobium sp. TaxID=82 RepID=UPI002C6E3F7F|nr:hypothetical protein [Hyphomicrobium sp.]HVZ04022.1 hypothetical protein [Hyphomicrobium sp.]